MHQIDMFGGRAERDRILELLAGKHTTYLTFCRAIAREIAMRAGSVSIDEVRTELLARDLPMPSDIGADERIFGTLFRSKDFRAIGHRTTSRADWAQRVGVNRAQITVYECLNSANA